MKNITIGTVKMPLADFVVSRNAILGITKSGKTYTAKGVAEQLLEHGVPIVVFDAIGVWRYLKTPGDGADAKGFKVVVAGGEHPDLPLTPKSAPEIVRAAIKENIPLIIDLYDPKLSKADWRRIVQSCFRILLYENKGLRHVFLEESAEFAPQKVMDGETYAEVEKLARMGGNKHVGITFINQRAQELNKAVLELCDNVVLLRQRGSHAIDSLEKWMDRLSPDQASAIANSMPHLTQGDCWIFTENGEVPIRTRSGLIKSLHPDRRLPEQALSGRKSVDADSFVEKLSGELSKLFEEQKENDPALLKKRIVELERQLKSQKPIIETKPVSILTDTDRELIQCATILCKSILQKTNQWTDDVCKIQGDLQRLALSGKTLPTVEDVQKIYRQAAPQSVRNVGNGDSSSATLPTGEEKILSACIQFSSGVTRQQLTVLTGFKRSTRDAYIARLREKGYLDISGDTVMASESGVAALPNAEPLPTGEELQNHWLARLPEGECKIFQILLDSYPNAVDRDTLSDKTGFKRSTRDAYLSRMSAKMIISEPSRGMVKAAEQLFQ